MAGDQQHIHDPAKAEEFARALGLQIGGEGYPFVGNWSTKGLYAYRSGQYNGIAYFGTGGSERDRLTMPHESEKYRPWNRYDPDIPAHIREKLVQLEDDDSTSIAEPSRYPPAATEPHIEAPSIDIDEGKIALKSVHGKHLSAQPDGRAEWNRDIASEWEYFHLEKRQGGKITLKGAHGMYVSAQSDGSVQINRQAAPPGGWEEFTVENRANNVVCLKSYHGKYLSAQSDGTAQWDRDHAPPGGWEDIQFVPQVNQNQEQESIKQQESIEILEAVTGRPIRFRLNNPPNNNHAWVGIYPPNAYDQNHGAENNRWKWLRNIDVNNASFPKQVAGSHSIRVFSDGGYTLHARKNFHVEKAEKSGRGGIRFAVLFGLFLILPGLPLLIVGSTSTGEDRLAMIIPGAVLMSVGGFVLLMSIAAGIRMESTEDRTPVKTYQEAVHNASTNIEVLSFNHNQPIRFRIKNPPPGNNVWVGIYPIDAGDGEHDDRWQWLRDLDVDNATLPGQSKGKWSIRLFSDGGYTLHERTDFEILEGYKKEVWMRNARIQDSRIIGDMIDHPTFGNMNRRTSTIIKRTKHGNMHRFETNNTTYLIKDEDLADEVNINKPFWGND